MTPKRRKKMSLWLLLPLAVLVLALPFDGMIPGSGLNRKPEYIAETLSRAQTLKKMAEYLEENPQHAELFKSKITAPLSPHLFDISLCESETFPIDSPQLTSYLTKVNSVSHSDLIRDVEQLFHALGPLQLKERIRLLQMTQLIGQISKSGKIYQILMEEAELFASSQKGEEREYSRTALQYYLSLETDVEMKKAQLARLPQDLANLQTQSP